MAVEDMTKPNFFIVGAPKSGTTALSEYLRSHPNLFMSHPKEPHYFAKDFWQRTYRYVKALDEYLELFKECTGEHLAVGEASVWYLYSSVAIRNIRQFNENAKIIVMLRNPIDMTYSLHSQLHYALAENEEDFEKAWRLQPSRRKGLNLSRELQKSDRTPEFVQYAQVGRLGDQVERLLDVFPVEQVKMILFDDFTTSTQAVYEDVLSFLEVPFDGRTSFPRINVNKTNKIIWLANLYGVPPWPLDYTVRILKKLLGVRSTGIGSFLDELNASKEPRKPLAPAFRSELAKEFSEDVQKLSQILGRDLSHWIT
jgi:hypothetical protein